MSKADSEDYFDVYKELCKENLFFITDDDYQLADEVSGLIYDTNSKNIKNNQGKWGFEDDSFAYRDPVLYVKYRTTNHWAFVVSVLIVLLALVFLFWKRK